MYLNVVSALFATAIMSIGIRCSFFYTITLAFSVSNFGFSAWAFHYYNIETERHGSSTSNRRPIGQR